jgi:hypothetical protein
MSLWRANDGSATYARVSAPHRLHSGTSVTNFYLDNGGDRSRVCLRDYTTKQYSCGTPYG